MVIHLKLVPLRATPTHKSGRVYVPTDRATAEAAPPADRKVVNPAGLTRYAGRGPHSQRHQEDTIQGRHAGGRSGPRGHRGQETQVKGSGPVVFEACAAGFATERELH